MLNIILSILVLIAVIPVWAQAGISPEDQADKDLAIVESNSSSYIWNGLSSANAPRCWVVARLGPAVNPAGIRRFRQIDPSQYRLGGDFKLVKVLVGDLSDNVASYRNPYATFHGEPLIPFYLLSGSVIAEVARVEENTAVFGSTAMIPADWEDKVQPAMLFIQQHPSLVQEFPNAGNVDTTTMLNGDNPFLKLIAFRLTLAKDQRTPLIPEALRKAKSYERADEVYAVLRPGDIHEPVIEPVIELIGVAANSEEMRPIALAVCAANPQPKEKTQNIQMAQLIQLMEKRVHEWNLAQSDPQLEAVLKKCHERLGASGGPSTQP